VKTSATSGRDQKLTPETDSVALRLRNAQAEYIAVQLAAPEFGPRRLFANLGPAAGQDDENVFAVIWNPES
jgi:uncharacterized protein (DUF736 family)